VNETYTLLYAFANGVSPLIGSLMHDNLGPSTTCDYVAYVNLAFGIISFIYNCGFSVFQEDREFKEKLRVLQEKGQKKYDEAKSVHPDVVSVYSKIKGAGSSISVYSKKP
jgi:hypothetical protein